VRLYAFLSQIIPYGDEDQEMLYSYGRLLALHLPRDADDGRVTIGDEVDLEYLRRERTSMGSINLREGDIEWVKSPTEVGTGMAVDEKAPLSEIIQVLNERFGTEFSEEDRLFFDQIREKAVKDQRVIQTAMANKLDAFQIGIRKLIQDLMLERIAENDDIVERYLGDADFQGAAFPILSREIFDAIHRAPGPEDGVGA
jgi:type I restriction enzyme R subunit